MSIKRIISTLILCAAIVCCGSITAMASADIPVLVIEDQITECMDQLNIRDFFLGSGTMADENTVHNVIGHLSAQGVDPQIWDNTSVTIFPCSCMQIFDRDDPLDGYASLENDGTTSIVMSGQSASFNNQLIHELGHAIADVYPDILSQYAEMRNYPYLLDKETQNQLEWEDKLCEWFAEDWKTIHAYPDLPKHRNRSSAPAPGPEVKEFFKKYESTGPKPDC